MPAHLLLSSETIREDLVMDVPRVTQHERTDLPTELEVVLWVRLFGAEEPLRCSIQR